MNDFHLNRILLSILLIYIMINGYEFMETIQFNIILIYFGQDGIIFYGTLDKRYNFSRLYTNIFFQFSFGPFFMKNCFNKLINSFNSLRAIYTANH